MAVMLYHRDGKSIRVEPEDLESYRSTGNWFLTVEDAEKEVSHEEKEQEDHKETAAETQEAETQEVEEIEILTSDGLSDPELRQKAKSLGIKYWHNKNIGRLTKEVDEWQPET